MSILTSTKERLKQVHPLRIFIMFFFRVMLGFSLYRNLLRKHSDGTVLLGTAWLGTGDYYICGCLLPEWLKKNRIEKYVFLTPAKAEKKVAELFSCMQDHLETLPDGPQFYHILLFRAFLGLDKCRFIYFHHQQPFPANDALNISNGDLQGFRGLNMLDFYLASGFRLPDTTPLLHPQFCTHSNEIGQWFHKYHLIEGKTVLLAPYSTGLEAFLPPITLWDEIAALLIQAGYTVCTNCFGSEQPVSGTVAISLPFSDIVPFLDRAGGFIGIRSGLCDIISSSTCKKIVLHTYHAKWWPCGMSIAYTGLENIFSGCNAREIEI